MLLGLQLFTLVTFCRDCIISLNKKKPKETEKWKRQLIGASRKLNQHAYTLRTNLPFLRTLSHTHRTNLHTDRTNVCLGNA